MSDQVANTFIEALHALEEYKDIEPLVMLYADGAIVGNVIAPDRFHGKDGARQFWTEYRGTFGKAVSEFRNVIAAGDRAALEWTTQGTGFDGALVQYRGVTILETADGQVTRSIAYFDPKSLGHQMEAAL